MRDQFHPPVVPLALPLALILLLSACAGQAPRRPGDSRAAAASLADPRSEFLIECERRARLNQPRSPQCPDESTGAGLSQPTLGPLATPIPSLPTLPGGLIR